MALSMADMLFGMSGRRTRAAREAGCGQAEVACIGGNAQVVERAELPAWLLQMNGTVAQAAASHGCA